MTKAAKHWSLTASARAARDARAAAIRYMRTSPVERQWQASVLARLHESRTADAGGAEPARSLLFALMGCPPPYPGSWRQASAMLLADEARCLSQADLYVLTPGMLAAVAAAAQTLRYHDLNLLRDDDLPGPAGLVMLPQPLRLRTPTGKVEELRACTWRVPWRLPLPAGWGFAGSELPAVRMSAYTATRANADFRHEVRRLRVVLPPILLESTWPLPLRPATAAQQQDQQRLETQVHRLNVGYIERENSSQTTGETHADYAPGTVIDDDEDSTFASRFMYAFWRICDQRIATITTTATGPTSRKTTAKARRPADVRVVALRRPASPAAGAGQPGQVQWQHRWVVRMHKVNQWYPSLGQHRVLFRGPYLKGPADKPLLGGDIVKGLVR